MRWTSWIRLAALIVSIVVGVAGVTVAAISLRISASQPSMDDILAKVNEETTKVNEEILATKEAGQSADSQAIQQVIHDEAAAALRADIDKALSLYTDDAVVRDAGSEQSWHGLQQIRDRYSELPQFTKLDHVDIQVILEPGGNSASAVASTSGEMLTNGVVTPVSSFLGEYWTFKKVEGTWRIETFTYAAR